ncbi:SMI1/KNR4 family protein [Ktedonospora formicarum]|uniref:SMI1/KNR4 family protein n=1 Tax=Ktedonospora formicarum TaxID=2778364 RepID=UPI003B75BE0E
MCHQSRGRPRFPLQTEFEYPPASEKDVVAEEEALGYPLPPLLRTLYTQVANGGFGPGYGLPQIQDHVLRKSDDSAWERSSRPVNLAIYLRKTSASATFAVPDYAWPDNLFWLCHWGCGIVSYVDCVSGHIFRGGLERNGYIFRHEADSLYEWFDLWLNGVDVWAE